MAGIYYPALSLYAGAKASANFGPDWICPPQSDMDFQPISALQPLPEAEGAELKLAISEAKRERGLGARAP